MTHFAFMNVPVMAGEFVLAFESVVATVLAPDKATREPFRLGAMFAGVVTL